MRRPLHTFYYLDAFSVCRNYKKGIDRPFNARATFHGRPGAKSLDSRVFLNVQFIYFDVTLEEPKILGPFNKFEQ